MILFHLAEVQARVAKPCVLEIILRERADIPLALHVVALCFVYEERVDKIFDVISYRLVRKRAAFNAFESARELRRIRQTSGRRGENIQKLAELGAAAHLMTFYDIGYIRLVEQVLEVLRLVVVSERPHQRQATVGEIFFPQR